MVGSTGVNFFEENEAGKAILNSSQTIVNAGADVAESVADIKKSEAETKKAVKEAITNSLSETNNSTKNN